MTIIAILQISAICVVRQPLESMESQFGPIIVLIQGPAKSRGGLRSLEIDTKMLGTTLGRQKDRNCRSRGIFRLSRPFFWVDLQSLLHPFFSGWIFRACYTPFFLGGSSELATPLLMTLRTLLSLHSRQTFGLLTQFYSFTGFRHQHGFLALKKGCTIQK